MAAFDLEEQEQISQIKAWWERYGKYITALLLVASVSAVGWQGWQWHQNTKAAEASALFFAVQQAAETGDAGKAREAAGQLVERYSGTAYAGMGALLSAAVQAQEGEVRNARAQLDWVMRNGKGAVLRDIARLRIAVLLFGEDSHEEALSLLSPAPHASLAARYAELRGDIQAVAGRKDEARKAYDEALLALSRTPGQAAERLSGIVRVKLDALES